jgi:hypothetical protein
VTECNHPRLIHVVNEEEGGSLSPIYRCEKCNDLLHVTFRPFKIEVVKGTPKQGTAELENSSE